MKTKRAALDYELMTDDEKVKTGRSLASQAKSLDDASIAYGSYVTLGVIRDPVAKAAMRPLRDALLPEYRRRLLKWFRFALLKRANLGTGSKDLANGLARVLADIPDAILEGRTPRWTGLRGLQGYVEAAKMDAALATVCKVVKADAEKAGVLSTTRAATILRVARLPLSLKWDAEARRWYVPPSRKTLDYRADLKRLRLRWNPDKTRWESWTPDLPADADKWLDVERAGAPLAAPPPPSVQQRLVNRSDQDLRAWFATEWYAANHARFTRLSSHRT